MVTLPFTRTSSRVQDSPSPRLTQPVHGIVLEHFIFRREHSVQLRGIRWVSRIDCSDIVAHDTWSFP